MHTDDNRRGGKKIVFGLLLILIGLLWALKQSGYPIPDWFLSWEFGLIILGLITGIATRFRRIGSFVLVAVGAYYFIANFYPELGYKEYIWPLLIMVIGIWVIFKPRSSCEYREHRFRHRNRRSENTDPNSTQDEIDIVSVFSNINKAIVSKSFKGGEVSAVFGGAEIDLTKADFEDPLELELNAIFGGIKLIVPPNWEVRSKITSVFGGVEDKRRNTGINSPPDKTILLEGNTVMGGIEIRTANTHI